MVVKCSRSFPQSEDRHSHGLSDELLLERYDQWSEMHSEEILRGDGNGHGSLDGLGGNVS